MVSAVAGENFVAASEPLGNLDGILVSVSATVGEEHLMIAINQKKKR